MLPFAAGKYSDKGQATCEACTEGKHQAAAGQSACEGVAACTVTRLTERFDVPSCLQALPVLAERSLMALEQVDASPAR